MNLHEVWMLSKSFRIELVYFIMIINLFQQLLSSNLSEIRYRSINFILLKWSLLLQLSIYFNSCFDFKIKWHKLFSKENYYFVQNIDFRFWKQFRVKQRIICILYIWNIFWNVYKLLISYSEIQRMESLGLIVFFLLIWLVFFLILPQHELDLTLSALV